MTDKDKREREGDEIGITEEKSDRMKEGIKRGQIEERKEQHAQTRLTKKKMKRNIIYDLYSKDVIIIVQSHKVV